jgi:hypothetical protein
MSFRKTIALFSICLAALLPLCLSGFFLAGRVVIRITMLEKMENDQLQTVHIPTKAIRWYKKNHELTIDGKMFDVKSIRHSGDTSIITGLYDEEDTELHEAMAGMHEQKNHGHNQSLLLFQVCLGIVAEQNPLMQQAFFTGDARQNQSFVRYSENIPQIYLPCFSPPPETGLS